MKCFSFSHVEKQEQEGPTRTTKPTSSDIRSSTTSYSTDYEPYNKRSAAPSSELTNSSQTTNVSADSIGGGAGASSSFCRNSFPSSSRRRPCSLRAFTFEELRTATRNFSRSLMIGEGGFGGVYRGVLRTPEEPNRRIDIAVKQLSRRGLQGHKEWATEVNYLGVIEHPNLVKLIGYCAEDDDRGIERLLVYEFMHNRSVQDHLCSRFQAPLPWSTRLKIAQDAARGLSYLHEGMDFQIIFRDFKSSNILLDDQWTAKLSDFGLARLGPEDGTGHVSTEVVGTVGYAAPEYIQTGRLTAKSDVWSYGVFLYELITGRRPFDRNRPRNEQKLLDYIKPHVSDPKKFEKIIDPRLQGRYSVITAQSLGAVANKCLGKQPRLRPKMSQVLDMVTQIVDASENGSTATPQLSLPPWENSTSSSSSSNSRSGGSKSKRERLRKRIFVDPITGENRWLTCLVCVET